MRRNEDASPEVDHFTRLLLACFSVMRCFIAASCFALSSILLLGPAPLSAAALDPASPPGFELHPSLEMTLFASEPQVVDPVGLSFDEFGRCYVIEMRDYPLGLGTEHRPGGTIRLLEDTDRDGRADRSVVFAEGLSFPTSILAWNGGVLVTAPPEVLFLKDTDGDGRADVREVVLRGFAGNSNSLAAHEPIRVALEALAAKAPVEVRKAAWQVSRAIQLPESELLRVALIDAATLAADPAQTLAVRCAQIGLLQLAGSTFAQDALLPLLQSHESADIQRAVLGVLRYQTEPEVASGLLKRWRGLTPALRPEVINALTSRRAWQGPLLDAIEQGTIQVGELNLDLEQRRHLLRQSTPANQSRAAKFFSDEEYSNRKQLVEEWLPKIPTHGEASKGREVFLRLCAGCHQSGELGNRVGPNLSDLSHRSVEDLVSNILDPNMAVNPAFVSVSCETRDGEFLTGVMDSENAESVVLLQAQGIKRVILRNQIQKLEFTGKSLMPEGLEAVMTLQELRDVVAFLQRR